MLRFAATVTAALLLCGFQARDNRALLESVAALTGDVEAARAFDYHGLKAHGVDLAALAETTDAQVRNAIGADERWNGGRCPNAAEMEVRAGLAAARLVDSDEAFVADRAAADAARDKWATFAGEVTNGRQVTDQPFASVASWLREAAAQTDPRSRELLTRVAKDQLYRHAFTAGDQVWGPLSEGARSRVHAYLGREICDIDQGNTAWLKADVAANGWYRISTQGEGASSAAWLMVQHADQDPDFQKEVLALLEPLAASRDIRPANYAYLHDRVAVGENRPQRYGTQGSCRAPNVWAPDELEDPDQVEAWRAEYGIGSLADYQARMHQYCADFTG